MKKHMIAALAASIALAGCSDERTPEELAQAEARLSIAAEEQELKSALAKLQAADPAVKDVYYGTAEDGSRVLHVVRENDDDDDVSSSVWPLLGGMAAGALIANMVSAGGPNQYAHQHPPASSSHYSREDERRRRNVVTSGYAGAILNQQRTRVTSPSYKPSPQISTRSSGVFNSSSSARAGGYSAGA